MNDRNEVIGQLLIEELTLKKVLWQTLIVWVMLFISLLLILMNQSQQFEAPDGVIPPPNLKTRFVTIVVIGLFFAATRYLGRVIQRFEQNKFALNAQLLEK